ncbi:MAG: phage tail tape measure protein [Myxococcota bacterium]|nr:phage tail tape measure protein [Myxococcota bacterium]
MAIGAKRKASIELGVTTSDMEKGLADARRKLRSFGADARKSLGERNLKGKFGMDPKKLGGKSKTFGGGFLGGALAGGLVTSGLMTAVGDIIDVEKALTRLQIAGEISTGDMATFRAEMMRVSNATGVSRNELVKGAAAYTALTGDAKGAATATQLFAEIAAGSGASMEDIARSAAALRSNLKIDPKDFRGAFDVLIKQGKMGAIEISDLAGELAKVAPQFGAFAGSRSVAGMSELGAMLQVTRQGFGGAEEAATGFNGLMTQIQRNAKKLRKAGVEIIDPKTGKMKNLLSIVRQISTNQKLMKPGALLETLGEEKAVRAMGIIIENLKEVDRIKSESLNSDQVAKDNLIWQQSAAGKISRAMEIAKNKIAEAFTPERIEAFAGALIKAANGLVAIIDALDMIISKMDIEGSAAKIFADRWVGAAAGMSPEQKTAKAQSMIAQATKVESGEMGPNERAGAAGLRIAAQELLAQGDVWNGGSTSKSTVDVVKVAQVLAEAMAKVKLQVTMNESEVAKKVDNAAVKRAPAARR